MELEQFKCEVCPKKMQWVSVSNGMPPKAGMQCLVTMINNFGQLSVREVFIGYGDHIWYCNNREVDMNVWSVIAWMPMPEPYKEKKDES